MTNGPEHRQRAPLNLAEQLWRIQGIPKRSVLIFRRPWPFLSLPVTILHSCGTIRNRGYTFIESISFTCYMSSAFEDDNSQIAVGLMCSPPRKSTLKRRSIWRLPISGLGMLRGGSWSCDKHQPSQQSSTSAALIQSAATYLGLQSSLRSLPLCPPLRLGIFYSPGLFPKLYAGFGSVLASLQRPHVLMVGGGRRNVGEDGFNGLLWFPNVLLAQFRGNCTKRCSFLASLLPPAG